MMEISEEDLKNFLIRKYMEEQITQDVAPHNEDVLSKYKSRLKEVTPDKLFEFLAEKGVSLDCPACGAIQLSVPARYNTQIEQLSVADEDEITDGNVKDHDSYKMLTKVYASFLSLGGGQSIADIRRSYYPLHCLNCGNLSLFRTSTVLKWIEKMDMED